MFDFPFDLGALPEAERAGRRDQPVLLEQHRPRRPVPLRVRRGCGNFQEANFEDEGAAAATRFAPRPSTGRAPTTPTSARPRTGPRRGCRCFAGQAPSASRSRPRPPLPVLLPTLPAAFGPGGRFAGRVVEAGGGPGPNTACTRAEITGNVSGQLRSSSGAGCNFDDKVANAALEGAIGAIVYNRAPEGDEERQRRRRPRLDGRRRNPRGHHPECVRPSELRTCLYREHGARRDLRHTGGRPRRAASTLAS